MTKFEKHKKGFVINSMPFLREVFEKTKNGYNNIDVKASCDKFGLPYLIIPAMVDLKILSTIGEKRTAKFWWKGGDISLTSEASTSNLVSLASKIHNKIQLDKTNKKQHEQHNVSLKNKNYIPIIGSTRASSKDVECAAILRSMNAIFATTTNNLVNTLPIILDIINKETNESTLSDRILKALIDGKYIVSTRPSLYTWKEVLPSEEHAMFIKDLIKEEITDSKVSRVFNFISFLYGKFKTSSKFSIRHVLKTYSLSNNDQAVIYKELLKASGHNYIWTYNETPSIMLAEKLVVKIKEYGAKYAKPKLVEKTPILLTDSYKVSHDKTQLTNTSLTNTSASYVGHTKTVFDYIKEHGTITTDKACELTGLNKHSISNILWRLKKDTKVVLSAFKTYSYIGYKGESAPLIKAVQQLIQPNMDFSKILENMKSRRDELTNELNELNEKISEGENILSLKQKENAFLEYGKKFSDVKSSAAKDIVKSHIVKSHKSKEKEKEKIKGKRGKRESALSTHTQQLIIDMMKSKEIVTSEEMNTKFYPGKKTAYAGCRSLSSMLVYMKKHNIIKNINKGQYSLV